MLEKITRHYFGEDGFGHHSNVAKRVLTGSDIACNNLKNQVLIPPRYATPFAVLITLVLTGIHLFTTGKIIVYLLLCKGYTEQRQLLCDQYFKHLMDEMSVDIDKK